LPSLQGSLRKVDWYSLMNSGILVRTLSAGYLLTQLRFLVILHENQICYVDHRAHISLLPAVPLRN
jgi:hypothetical protein